MKVLCKKDFQTPVKLKGSGNLEFVKNNYYEVFNSNEEYYEVGFLNRKIKNKNVSSSRAFYKKPKYHNADMFDDYFYPPGITMKKIRKEKLEKINGKICI